MTCTSERTLGHVTAGFQDGAIIDSFWIRKEVHKPFDQLKRTERGYLPADTPRSETEPRPLKT